MYMNDPSLKVQLMEGQLHFVVQYQSLPPFTVIFKNPETLAQLIEELAEGRRKVWPECQLTGTERKSVDLRWKFGAMEADAIIERMELDLVVNEHLRQAVEKINAWEEKWQILEEQR
jgi:hypothetical protein